MSSPNTHGVVSALGTTATNHENQADEFRAEAQRAMDEVEGLKSTNWGDLMTKLDSAQDIWTDSVRLISNDLDAMAGHLRKAASDIQNQDSSARV